MPIKIPVVQTGLEASIKAAAQKAGKSLKINMGSGAKSIEGLSQPLGRISGKADQFTKSMEAANARVLAFGASVGVLSAVTRGFQNLVVTTIEVEKSLASINSILGTNEKQLKDFGKTIFDVAKNTEQSFDTVANAALELSRQGLSAEEVQKRLSDSLILTRLSGLGASEAVAGLTAAINSFNKEGLTSEQVLNKLSAAAVSAAVSERDLIEGIKRSGSVAVQAGVSFDELIGVITAVQKTTARGGAVIGNSFKTIFTRIQSIDKLETMQNLGVQVTDASGQVLGATKLIQNLAKVLGELPDAKKLQIAEGLVGKFQIAPFLAILEDYNKETSTAISVTKTASTAFNEAYSRNIVLNETLSAAINEATVNLKELANTLGKIGVTDSLQNLLGFFNSLVGDIKETLDGEGVGGDMARGIVKGISSVISGPGLAIFGAIILKLGVDLAKFGVGSLKTFFGLNKAAQQQATLQGQIASTLLGNESIQKTILNIENQQISAEQKKVLQTKFFTTALNEQLAIMTKMQGIAATVAPGVMRGTRGGKGRFGTRKSAAGGFIPNYNAVAGYGSESSDISKGVGGAPSSARPVTIPNFNFGSGQKGTMVANNSEYMVPNFAGGDGSAIFNQDMVSSMGLPAGARKIGAAGGYIPNFAKTALGSFRNTYSMNKINPSNRRVFFKTDGTPETDKVKNLLKDHPNSPEAKKLIALRGQIYNANENPKSVMLVPKKKKFKINQANHKFQKPYKGFNQFLGGIAGIDPKLGKKNSPFEKLLNIKKNLNDALTSAVNTTLNTAIGEGKGSLKVNPKKYNTEEVQNIVLKEGGKGAFSAMRGAMFEAIIQAVTGGVAQGSEGTLDVVFDSNRAALEDIFGLKNKNFKFGDFKNSKKSKGTFARQIISNVDQKGVKANVKKKAASGYIPNFAGGLGDAIARESAAGLPINQIRINQDSSLKNSGNPMGLAVTNTRDEPTGAIPNFASTIRVGDKNLPTNSKAFDKSLKDFTKRTKEATKGQRDMLGGIFATQLAFSAISGATSEMNEGFGRVVNRLATMGSALTTAAFAGSAINDFGKSIGGKRGGVISKLGIYGAALGAGISVFKGVTKMFQDMSGETDRSSLAMAQLADATDKLSVKFSGLSATEQAEAGITAKDAVFRSVDRDSQGKAGKIVQGTQAFFQNLGSAFGIGPGGTRSGEIRRGFSTDEVEKTVLETAKNFAAFGESSRTISERLEKFGSEIDAKEASTFIKELSDLDKQAKKFREALEKAPTQDLNVDLIPDDFFPSLPRTFKADVRRDVLNKRAGVEKDTTGKDEEKAQRINTSIAKQQIQLTVDLAKADKTLLNQMDERILKAELGRTLSEGDLIALKTEREILDANVGLRNKTLDVVANMSKASTELTFKEKASKELQELIAEASKKTNFTQKERSNLIDKVNKLLEESDQSIKDILGKEIDSLKVSKETTADTIKRLEALGRIKETMSEINQLTGSLDVKAKGTFRKEAFDESESAARAISERELASSNRSRGAQTILGGERLAKLAARDAVLDAKSNATIQSANLKQTQESGATDLIKRTLSNDAIGKIAISSNLKETGRSKLKMEEVKMILETASAGSIVDQLGTGVLKEAQNLALNETDRAEIGEFIKNIEDQNSALKRQSEATIKNAEANEKAAGFFQKSAAQLSQDLATELRRGGIQGGIDAKMIVDPAQRAKALLNERSRGDRADALDDQNFKEFRRLVEEDQFAGQLIDASAQFAQNIGNAMTQAIAKGENLKDLLLGAASSFFNTLSQAFMQKAVNNIISGFNAGGKVRGGSGNRDDVPALLTGGEFVMKKSSVNKYGSSFMSALNSGAVPTMQRGGLFTPGTFGQGAMKGKDNLLDFATQGSTTGNFDKTRGGSGFASVNLAPQSGALTMFGRRNSPAFQREQASKEAAFGLFTQQANKEAELKEQKKQASKGLLGSIGSALFSFGFNSLTDLFSKKATGGSIPYTSGVDTVPTMLSGGEFVMNAAATQRIGRGNLNALNSGGGGGSGDVVGKLDELISVSDNSGETVINITVNSDGTSNSQGNGDDQQNSLASKIKDVVKQVIDDEKRLGGSLRQARA